MFAVLCLAAATTFFQDAIDEQIQEFKKYYKRGLTLQEQVEAIHVLEECDRVAAAELLVDASIDPEFTVRENAIKVLGSFRTGEVVEWLVGLAGEKKETRSGKRAVACEALGRIGDGRATETLIENLEDRDFDVRRASIVSLGQLRAVAAIDPLIGVLQDEKEAALVTVALDALGLMKQPDRTTDAVLGLLHADEWQVKAAALGALRVSRPLKAIQPLIDFLRDEEGRLRGDALDALQSITGTQYQDDPALWQRWWDTVKDRFKVPTEEEIAKIKAAQAENQARYVGKAAEFVGVPTKSERLVFVIDVSGSMEELIQEKENFKLADRGYTSFQKMEIIKSEMVRTIEGLDGSVKFNMLAFATNVMPWKKGLVSANVVNKRAAVDWVQGLAPIGGASQGFRARAGLSGSANMSDGKTNTYQALMEALEAGGKGGYDKNYHSDVDTIFFLSDGVPTAGKFLEAEDILAEVKRANSLRKIAINTIAIGEMEHNLMKRLAAENYGTFVDLGK